jgi:hypothetical protein
MNSSSLFGIRLSTMAVAAVLAATDVQAKTLLLMCRDGAVEYQVRFDTIRQTASTTHPRYKRPLTIERYQEDEDGLLLWVSMAEGPSQSNMLAHWGKQRWVRRFHGYDQHTTDACL